MSAIAGHDVQAYIQEMADANAVRYFTGACFVVLKRFHDRLFFSSLVVGVVVMLYDHAITFGEEVRCIWKAPRSFAKYLFLLNRYFVPALLLAILHGACSVFEKAKTPLQRMYLEMCGFNGNVYEDRGYTIRGLAITIRLMKILGAACYSLLPLY